MKDDRSDFTHGVVSPDGLWGGLVAISSRLLSNLNTWEFPECTKFTTPYLSGETLFSWCAPASSVCGELPSIEIRYLEQLNCRGNPSEEANHSRLSPIPPIHLPWGKEPPWGEHPRWLFVYSGYPRLPRVNIDCSFAPSVDVCQHLR